MSSTKTGITLWIKVHLIALEVENIGDEMSSHWNQYWMLPGTTSASLFCSSGWNFKLPYLIIWNSYKISRTLKINICFYLCYMTLSKESLHILDAQVTWFMGFLPSPKLLATKPKKENPRTSQTTIKVLWFGAFQKSLIGDGQLHGLTHLKGIKKYQQNCCQGRIRHIWKAVPMTSIFNQYPSFFFSTLWPTKKNFLFPFHIG